MFILNTAKYCFIPLMLINLNSSHATQNHEMLLTYVFFVLRKVISLSCRPLYIGTAHLKKCYITDSFKNAYNCVNVVHLDTSFTFSKETEANYLMIPVRLLLNLSLPLCSLVYSQKNIKQVFNL